LMMLIGILVACICIVRSWRRLFSRASGYEKVQVDEAGADEKPDPPCDDSRLEGVQDEILFDDCVEVAVKEVGDTDGTGGAAAPTIDPVSKYDSVGASNDADATRLAPPNAAPLIAPSPLSASQLPVPSALPCGNATAPAIAPAPSQKNLEIELSVEPHRRCDILKPLIEITEEVVATPSAEDARCVGSKIKSEGDGFEAVEASVRLRQDTSEDFDGDRDQQTMGSLVPPASAVQPVVRESSGVTLSQDDRPLI